MRPGQAGSTEAYDRPWKRVSTAAFSLVAEEGQPTARVPGAGGCKGLILLRPLNAGRRWFPRKRHADGFGATFCHQKYHKFGKKANVSIGIDNQVVFLSSSLYTGCRIGSRRHRQAWVQLPKHYLVRECLLFPKIVIYRLLHFHSS